MLTFPSLGALDKSLSVGVYLCTAPTDMRKGFDTLAALVQEARPSTAGCDAALRRGQRVPCLR